MNPVDVLYVEDDATDVDFAMTAINELGCGRLRLNVVGDGHKAAEALGMVGGEAEPAGKLPGMILLDLNLPKIHGKELLRRIKADRNLSEIPVVIVSTSDHQVDIDDSYRLGAAGYFTKPSSYSQYRRIFQAICDYWGNLASLPSVAGGGRRGEERPGL